MRPVVVERDGVRVAVAVQVQVRQCQHRGASSHDLPASCDEEPSAALEEVAGAAGVALSYASAAARLLGTAAILGVGRAFLLALNVIGLLGAKLARGYLLGWAQLGGTHKQLSRSISPWLPEGRTPLELPALVAEVLEKPKTHQPQRTLGRHGYAMFIGEHEQPRALPSTIKRKGTA